MPRQTGIRAFTAHKSTVPSLVLALAVTAGTQALAQDDVIFRNAFSPLITGSLQQTWFVSEMNSGWTLIDELRPPTVCSAADVASSNCEWVDFKHSWGDLGSAPTGWPEDAHAQTFANGDGTTYYATVIAPDIHQHQTPGGWANYRQRQWYRVNASSPSVRAIISKLNLSVESYQGRPLPRHCPAHVPRDNCIYGLYADAIFGLTIGREFEDDRLTGPWDGKSVHRVGGYVKLLGTTGMWFGRAAPGPFAQETLFTDDDFEMVLDEEFEASVRLRSPKTINIPLDRFFNFGDRFYVDTTINVKAYNEHAGESYAGSLLRDPVETDGIELQVTGLEPVDGPMDLNITPAQDEPCDGAPDPGAGNITFNEISFQTVEFDHTDLWIPIERVGGSNGPVTVRVRTHSDTAMQVLDFQPMNQLVYFADGELGVRYVPVNLVDDAQMEPEESFSVYLTEPGGCAQLGEAVVAEIAIIDDDTPAATYAVGGVVAGLEGSGLVLQNFSTDDCPIDTDGPFEFCRRFGAGSPYNITVGAQPQNPLQDCEVINGEGTIVVEDVTDIEVHCTTLSSRGLDLSFGDNGRATGLLDELNDMALQSDGAIVAVGDSTLARFTADGAPDVSFGIGGRLDVMHNGTRVRGVEGVAVQNDDRIVVVGSAVVGEDLDFLVARFLSDGSVDESFGTGGTVTVNFEGEPDGANDVVIQADGSIVAVGVAELGGLLNDQDFAVVRLTPDGQVDNSFFDDGRQTFDIGGGKDIGKQAVIGPDGSIAITGRAAENSGSPPDFTYVLLSSAGEPGIVLDETNESGNDWDESVALAVQSDSKVVLVGNGTRRLTDPPIGVPTFEIGRYLTTGERDPSFGVLGRVENLPYPQANGARGNAVAILPDGRITVAGVVDASENNGDFAIGVLNPDGTLDESFGDLGAMRVDFFGEYDEANAILTLPSGAILVGGDIRDNGSFSAGIVRIVP